MTTIELIDNLLKARGISAARMMKELGFSSGLYSQWRKYGQNPSTEKLKAISKYFDVPIELLMDPENLTIDENGDIIKNISKLPEELNDDEFNVLYKKIEQLRIKREHEESIRIIDSIVSVLAEMSEDKLKKTEQMVNILKD